MPDRSVPTRTTRQRVLDAGIDLWCQERPPVLFGGYTVARLAKAAGITRATFYSYWTSSAEYMDDLLDHLAELDPPDFDQGMGSGVALVQGASLDVAGPFLAACDAQLRSVIASPTLRIRLGFLSKMDDPDVAERLRARYRALEQRQWRAPEQMLQSWGRELRPPLEAHQLMAIHSAMQEGLAARHVIDPEFMPVEIYGYASLVMLMLLTRRTDDPRTIDDVIGVADLWPMTGMQLRSDRARARPATRRPITPEMGREMTVQARTLLASLSWENLELSDVGRSIGLGEDMALRAFHSKAGLGASVVALSTTERFDEMERTSDLVADLRTMLDIMRSELELRPVITQSILTLFASETRFPSEELMVWSPLPIITNQIFLAMAANKLRDDLNPKFLAWTLLRVLLLDSAPGVAVPGRGLSATELVLLGAGAEPRSAPSPDHDAW